MPHLSYPSETFPGPPSVTVDVPDSWAPVRVGGALLSCRRVESDHGCAPNVAVRGFQRTSDFTMRHALLPFLGVNVSSTDEQIGTVVQIHLFAGGSDAQDSYAEVQQILQTVRIVK